MDDNQPVAVVIWEDCTGTPVQFSNIDALAGFLARIMAQPEKYNTPGREPTPARYLQYNAPAQATQRRVAK